MFFIVKKFELFTKIISLYNPIEYLAILYPKSLAKLVAEVGSRHNHQILFDMAFNNTEPLKLF